VSILLLTAPVSLAACAQTFDARILGVPATVAVRPSDAPAGEAFRVSRKAVFAFWGMVPMQRPSLELALAGQVAGESEIANLRITVKSGFGDLLATLITGGLIVPRTVVFEGIVVPPDTAATP
jgi:hypothetical protein